MPHRASLPRFSHFWRVLERLRGTECDRFSWNSSVSPGTGGGSWSVSECHSYFLLSTSLQLYYSLPPNTQNINKQDTKYGGSARADQPKPQRFKFLLSSTKIWRHDVTLKLCFVKRSHENVCWWKTSAKYSCSFTEGCTSATAIIPNLGTRWKWAVTCRPGRCRETGARRWAPKLVCVFCRRQTSLDPAGQ
jgi:hypothetical protein